MPPKAKSVSASSARLLELFAEVETPESIQIPGSDIVITPPTRTRRKAMNAAEMKMYLCKQLLSQAINAVSIPEPDESDEVAHAYWVTERKSSQENVAGINAQHDEAEADFEKAFFGDAYDDVMDFFEDKAAAWDKFVPFIRGEFLPAAPDNGVCPSCGRVDEVEAGKAPESST